MCFPYNMENFDTERLIIEIQSRPSIWDSSSNEYSNRELKQKGWEELIEIFGGTDLSILEKKEIGQELQKRWKNLRGCYVRELRRQKEIKSGSGAGSRKSEYIYYKKLKFLQKVITIRDAEVQEGCTENSQNEKVGTQESENNEEKRSQKTKRLKIKQNIENENDPLVEILNKSIEKWEKREKAEDDEDRMFLLSLLKSLKSVPPEKKMALKINIMILINEYIQGNLRERSLFYDHSGRFYELSTNKNSWYRYPSQSEAGTAQYPVASRSGYCTLRRFSTEQINNSENTSSTNIPISIISPASDTTDTSNDLIDLCEN